MPKFVRLSPSQQNADPSEVSNAFRNYSKKYNKTDDGVTTCPVQKGIEKGQIIRRSKEVYANNAFSLFDPLTIGRHR